MQGAGALAGGVSHAAAPDPPRGRPDPEAAGSIESETAIFHWDRKLHRTAFLVVGALGACICFLIGLILGVLLIVGIVTYREHHELEAARPWYAKVWTTLVEVCGLAALALLLYTCRQQAMEQNHGHASTGAAANAKSGKRGRLLPTYVPRSDDDVHMHAHDPPTDEELAHEGHRQAAMALFDAHDRDGDGHLSLAECVRAMKEANMGSLADMFVAQFVRYDSDGSGSLNRDEFHHLYLRSAAVLPERPASSTRTPLPVSPAARSPAPAKRLPERGATAPTGRSPVVGRTACCPVACGSGVGLAQQATASTSLEEAASAPTVAASPTALPAPPPLPASKDAALTVVVPPPAASPITAMPVPRPTVDDLFRRYDTDGDGQLAMIECLRAIKELAGPRARHFTALYAAHDTDADGYLSADEFVALHDAVLRQAH